MIRNCHVFRAVLHYGRASKARNSHVIRRWISVFSAPRRVFYSVDREDREEGIGLSSFCLFVTYFRGRLILALLSFRGDMTRRGCVVANLYCHANCFNSRSSVNANCCNWFAR